MTARRRIYQMGPWTGGALALPLALVPLWYAWSAYATLDRYRRAADPKQRLTAQLFQIALHDELFRDLRRLRLPDRPEPSALPTFELSLSRDNLDRLGQGDGPAPEGEASYVRALIRKDGEVRDARVRYRGGQPWHFLNPQKSMKVRIDRGELLDGARVFNLLNDPTPFGLEDEIILDLARGGGLLTPEYHPVRVRLNNSDLGVFRYEAQPDESLLRRNRRLPGNMYSGDAETKPVFFDRAAWRKVAFRSEETRKDERELDRLLAAVAQATHLEFGRFAEEQIDLDRYALFDALDVVFGGSEHDWLSNHKFYANPYTGKLEPVAWSFRGFQHERALNLVDHPLLIRLKLTPGYLARRDRAVYELLTGSASLPAIRARVESAYAALAPELRSDPFWDAYKLLPKGLRFLRQMPRPMSLDRWALAGEAELAGFAERSAWLLNTLEDPGLEVHAQGGPGAARIELTLDGEAAYALRGAFLSSSACAGASPQARLWADADRDGVFDPRRDALLAALNVQGSGPVGPFRSLFAGTRLVARDDPRPKNGPVRTLAEPRTYTYFATAERCPIDGGALVLDNLVTGGSTRLELAFGATDGRTAPATRSASTSTNDVPRFAPDERSPHPWAFPPEPAPEVVLLGPGVVRMDATARYGAHQTLRIAPRTELRLGPDVSLVCRGPVLAEGPIAIVRALPDRPYGGIALQGLGTRGSRLLGLHMRGGSRVKGEVVDYSAVLNVHDTSDILIEGLVVEGARDAGDVLHVNGVDGLRLHEVTVFDAPVDGIDLELTRAELRGIRVIHAGDDCLDIGASEVRVRDSVLAGCTNNGVSAGEESAVSLHGLLIAGAKAGVLAKNASEVRATRSVIWQAESALKTHFKELYYRKESRIGTSELYAVRCGALRDAARGTAIEVGSAQSSLPDESALRHLRVNVLHLARWTDLEDAVGRLPEGTRP